MARPVTKGAWMVTDTRRIPDMIAHALRVAYSGRRGPVHLTIPVDIQQNVVSEDEVAFYAPSEYRGIGAAQASQTDIEHAIAILRGAERPLIVAGSAAAYARSGEALQEFIETDSAAAADGGGRAWIGVGRASLLSRVFRSGVEPDGAEDS